ncbi:transposase [Azospirillaceae bacterium]
MMVSRLSRSRRFCIWTKAPLGITCACSEKGRAGIESLGYGGGARGLTPEQEQELEAELDKHLYLTAKDISVWVATRFEVSYTPHAMAKCLVRLGFCYKKPKKVPAKADEEKQRAFLEETLRPLMEAASAEKPLYFVDAIHPAHTGHAAFGWIRKGKTKELKSNHGRSNLNVNGALSWPDRTVIHREEKRVTSAAMIALFEDILAKHQAATVISIVLDNARYNHSKELRAWLDEKGQKLHMVYLPSYAPNLNLIERFWLFLKKKALWNRYYATFADFRDAIRNVFASLGSFKDELASLLSSNFNLIGSHSSGILAA